MVLFRDNYHCQYCKYRGMKRTINLQVHHIVKITSRFDLVYNPDNLISLCTNCHSLFDREKQIFDKNGKVLNKEKILKEIINEK